MEPEVQPRASAAPASGAGPDEPSDSNPYRPKPRSTHSIFIGSHGLRAGWSVLIAVIIYRLCFPILGTLAIGIYPGLENFDFTPTAAFFQELVPLLAMIAAGFVVSRIEQHSIFAYNLAGPQPALRFISGLAAGFAGLSALVGTLAMGGWLHFGPVALSGIQILKFGALWALVFLLVGCVEEGIFRCYLQFTLERGINFWWALLIISVVCADLFLRSRGSPGIIAFIWMDTPRMLKGNAAWGVYAAALLGLVPCLLLYVKKIDGSNFWQAAWVTSTLFGFIHTGNGGENWIGVFAAAAIGFVFCVSVRLTGSAWWAIGCHAAWDWAETYFYGTADSGFPAQGHYLTTRPAGPAIWSGGADGPEGSVLVLGIILMLLAALLVLYGQKKPSPLAAPTPEPAAG